MLSQLKRVVRTNYSNPPTYRRPGRWRNVLTTPELRALWDRELGEMRERIKAMRRALVEKVAARAPGFDLGFVMQQRGMFSYSGLSKEQVRRLREEFVGLRGRQRPHLRGGAEYEERRLRRRRDRESRQVSLGAK